MHVKAVFHFNRLIAKRSVFHCFVNTLKWKTGFRGVLPPRDLENFENLASVRSRKTQFPSLYYLWDLVIPVISVT